MTPSNPRAAKETPDGHEAEAIAAWNQRAPADETDRLKKQLGLALEALESIADGADGAEGTAQDALDDITRVGMEAAAIAEGGEHDAG